MKKSAALLSLMIGVLIAGCNSNGNQLQVKGLFSDRNSDPPLGLLENACKLLPYVSPLPPGLVVANTTLRISSPARKVEDLPKTVGDTRSVGASLGNRLMPDQSLHNPGKKDCYGSIAEVTIGTAGADRRFPVFIAFDYKEPDGMTKSFKGSVLVRFGEEVTVTNWGDATMSITLGE